MVARRSLIAALVMVGAMLSACGGGDSADETVKLTGADRTAVEPGIGVNQVVEGKKLPTVDLVDVKGDTVSTKSLLGKTPLVLNYWFSSCRPCKKELPDFAAVDQEMAGKVRFVGVNGFDSAKENEDFARKLGVKYDLLLDPSGMYSKSLGLATAPVTLFVTADGTIVKQAGEIDASELRSIINTQLLTP